MKQRGILVIGVLVLAGCGPLSVLPAADPNAGHKQPTRPPLPERAGVTVLSHEPVPLDEALVPELLPPPLPERSVVGGRTVTESERRASDRVTERSDGLAVPGPSDLVSLAAPEAPAADALPVDRGRYLYALHCATCHGGSGLGDGPSGQALLYPPSDLTRVAERRGGVFAAAKIAAHLNGQIPHPSHGSADQPIWGPGLQLGDAGTGELQALLRFLETLQAPAAEEEVGS